MIYFLVGGEVGVEIFMIVVKYLIEVFGLVVFVIMLGGIFLMMYVVEVLVIMEYCFGIYVYNDRLLVVCGVCGWEDCVLSVVVIVVFVFVFDWVIIDVGFKVLILDLLGLMGYGYVLGCDDIIID